MTTAEMIATLNQRLDNSDGFWTASEEYAALSNGQREVQRILASKGKYFKDLTENVTATLAGEYVTASQSVLSVEYSYPSASAAVYYPARMVSESQAKKLDDNEWTKATIEDPISYQVDGKLYFMPFPAALGSLLGTVKYVQLKDLGEIDASTEPKLDELTHNAIVQWAYAELLTKNPSRAGESENEKKIFYEMVSTL